MEADRARSVEDLILLENSGSPMKYLFFWGHTPARGGSVTKACFSQWWDSPFEVEGVLYLTAEHFMMAAKARLFSDQTALEKILAVKHPKQAKEAGRMVRHFDEEMWKRERFRLVVEGNEAKLRQHPPLREFLTHTGDRVLVEASPRDAIWGIGLSQDDPRAARPSLWLGLNLLGFALMEVRARLASENA